MTVRLATGASITVMKRVVRIHYTFKDLQYDADFIVLDLDDKFYVILGLPWLRKYEPRISWQHRSVRCLPLVERFRASTSVWVSYE